VLRKEAGESEGQGMRDPDILMRIKQINTTNIHIEDLLRSFIDKRDAPLRRFIQPSITNTISQWSPHMTVVHPSPIRTSQHEPQTPPQSTEHRVLSAEIILRGTTNGSEGPAICNRTHFALDLVDTLAAADAVKDNMVSSYVLTLLHMVCFKLPSSTRLSRYKDFSNIIVNPDYAGAGTGAGVGVGVGKRVVQG
jgi:hypothetical protein